MPQYCIHSLNAAWCSNDIGWLYLSSSVSPLSSLPAVLGMSDAAPDSFSCIACSCASKAASAAVYYSLVITPDCTKRFLPVSYRAKPIDRCNKLNLTLGFFVAAFAPLVALPVAACFESEQAPEREEACFLFVAPILAQRREKRGMTQKERGSPRGTNTTRTTTTDHNND
jgi:hypothetical protein